VISTDGLLTVHEAAKRLNRSTEQVRRYLREGKLKGQRIGNQWFVEEASLEHRGGKDEPLIPRDLMDEIEGTRQDIFRRTGVVFDIVTEIREDRRSR
jgi:excisionase family DNA binding protein